MCKDYSLKCTGSSSDREFTSDSHTDVIIVGAGVTGSALAHTLGKVHTILVFINNFNEIILRVTDKLEILGSSHSSEPKPRNRWFS